MRIILRAIGLVALVIGSIWFLQGLNVLHGSPMSGESQWTRNGAIVAIAGIALLAAVRRRSRG